MSNIDAFPPAQSATKRWLKRIGKGALVCVAALVAAGAIYEGIGRMNAGRRYPPPGKMVDIGGRRIHLDCRGAGSPTVLFESGLGSGGSTDWRLVQDRIAAVTRACSYDRAGIMWSDSKATPQDGAAVADDLHATLRRAGITGPLVLVGHSIGGPYTTIFTGRYGDQVAGLVLVDPSHPDQIARLGKVTSADLNPRGKMWIVRTAAALSWVGVPRLVASMSGSPRLPAQANAQVAAYASHSVGGSLSEVEGFDRTMEQERAAHDLADRPLIVLTSMLPLTPKQKEMLGLNTQGGARFKQVWKELHGEMSRWSRRGEQRIVPDAGHYIQVDRPDAVVAAVDDVVRMVRAR